MVAGLIGPEYHTPPPKNATSDHSSIRKPRRTLCLRFSIQPMLFVSWISSRM
jgi:hypothetical protein